MNITLNTLSRNMNIQNTSLRAFRSSLVLSFIAISMLCLLSTSTSFAKKKKRQSRKGLDSQVAKATKSIGTALQVQAGDKGLMTTVAVLPFKALDKKAKRLDLTSALAELFSNKLSTEPGVISVERGRIEGVIKELKRAKRGELDPKGAAQAGKLIGAQHVLLGSLTTLGSELQISARVVASETGVIVKAVTLKAPRTDFVAFHKDVVVTKSRSGAIFRSVLLPGWGQLYNGDTQKGWMTLTLALGALGTAGAYGFLGTQAESKYQENSVDTVSERAVANGHYQKARIALMSAGAFWVYAVVDAFIMGKSYSEIDLKGWGSPEGGGLVFSREF